MSDGDDFVEGQVAQQILDSLKRVEAIQKRGVHFMASFRQEVAAANAAQAAATQALKDELDGTVAAQAAVQAEVDQILALAQAGTPIDPAALQPLKDAVAAAQASIDAVSGKVDTVQAGVTDIQAQVDAPPTP